MADHVPSCETAAASGLLLLLLMAFAVTWAGTSLGLLVRDPDGAGGIAMTFIFPAMLPSRIFVPVGGLPSPLRQLAWAAEPYCAPCRSSRRLTASRR
jgi:ABC-2 type transport system permease protein